MLESLSVEGEDAFNELRGSILEEAARLEFFIDYDLALLLGRAEREQDALYREVLWWVPFENRIALLGRLLDENDLADKFPFLALMGEILITRNILAHMILDIFASTDEVLVFRG